MISLIFDRIFIKVFRLISPYSFSTPKLGNQLSNDEYKEIVEFRDHYYQDKLPHLTSSRTELNEKMYQFDLRSYHFRVYNKKNLLIGCLRLTPDKFETESFFSVDTNTKENYLEISRLLAMPGHKGLSKTMLIHAGVYSVLKLKKTGFVALSRTTNLSLFKNFGMTSQSPAKTISSRASGEYHYIKSDFKQLRNNVIKHFGTNMKKRFLGNLKPQIAQLIALIALSQLAYSQDVCPESTVLNQKVNQALVEDGLYKKSLSTKMTTELCGKDSEYISIPDNGFFNFNSSNFKNEIKKVTESEETSGNKIKLLVNDHLFRKKINLLKKSNHSFWTATMLMRCDKSTLPYVRELENAVNRGVDVRIIVDYLADLTANFECTKQLKKIGVKVLRSKYSLKTAYKELADLEDHKFSNAFHGKLWIVDRKIAIIDSTNINNLHHNSNGVNWGYRDTGAVVEGPLVTDMTLDFINLWKNISGDSKLFRVQSALLRLKKQEERNLGMRGSDIDRSIDKQICRYISQGKHAKQHSIGRTYTKYVAFARNHIFLTPLEYLFDFNKTHWSYQNFYKTIERKSVEDNVRVDYLVNYNHAPWTPYTKNPKEFENFNTTSLSKKILDGYKEFLPIGQQKLEEYATQQFQKTDSRSIFWGYSQFNHSKTMLIDEWVSIIGTHNMNPRSFTSDFEMSLICHDRELAKSLKEHMIIDLINSTPIVK